MSFLLPSDDREIILALEEHFVFLEDHLKSTFFLFQTMEEPRNM